MFTNFLRNLDGSLILIACATFFLTLMGLVADDRNFPGDKGSVIVLSLLFSLCVVAGNFATNGLARTCYNDASRLVGVVSDKVAFTVFAVVIALAGTAGVCFFRWNLTGPMAPLHPNWTGWLTVVAVWSVILGLGVSTLQLLLLSVVLKATNLTRRILGRTASPNQAA